MLASQEPDSWDPLPQIEGIEEADMARFIAEFQTDFVAVQPNKPAAAQAPDTAAAKDSAPAIEAATEQEAAQTN